MRLFFVLFVVAFATFGCDSVAPLEPASNSDDIPSEFVDDSLATPIVATNIDVFVGEPAVLINLNQHLATAAFDTARVAYRIAAYDSTRLGLFLSSPTTLQLEAALPITPSALPVDVTVATAAGDTLTVMFEVNVRDACLEPDPLPERNRILFTTYLGENPLTSLFVSDIATDSTYTFVQMRSCRPSVLEATLASDSSGIVVVQGPQDEATPVAVTTVTPSGRRHRHLAWYVAHDVCQLAQEHPNAVYFPIADGRSWTYEATSHYDSGLGQRSNLAYTSTWTLVDVSDCTMGQQSFTLQEHRVGTQEFGGGLATFALNDTTSFPGRIAGRFVIIEQYADAQLQTKWQNGDVYTDHFQFQWFHSDAAQERLEYSIISDTSPGASIFGTVYRNAITLERNKGITYLRGSHKGKRWGGYTELRTQ
ncbi:MAG: hypothetical protein RhofKO_15730 [Rhodothermales bacterium]